MVSARWGGVRTDPYNPNPKDADLDGIVQEGTFFERPVGTKFISGALELISGAQGNSLEDIAGLVLVDESGNRVDYTPTWQGMRLSVGQQRASIGQRRSSLGDRGTIASGPTRQEMPAAREGRGMRDLLGADVIEAREERFLNRIDDAALWSRVNSRGESPESLEEFFKDKETLDADGDPINIDARYIDRAVKRHGKVREAYIKRVEKEKAETAARKLREAELQRDFNIAGRIRRGESVEEIAEDLGISAREVRSANRRISRLRRKERNNAARERRGRATRRLTDSDASSVFPEDLRRDVEGYDWKKRRSLRSKKNETIVDEVIESFWSDEDEDAPWDILSDDKLRGYLRNIYPDASDEDIEISFEFYSQQLKDGTLDAEGVFQHVLDDEGRDEFAKNMFLHGKKINLGTVKGSDGKDYTVMVTPELEEQTNEPPVFMASGRFNYEVYDSAGNRVGEYTPTHFGSYSDSGFTRGIIFSGDGAPKPVLENVELGANAIIKIRDDSDTEIEIDTRGMGLADKFNANVFMFAQGLGVEKATMGAADDGFVVWPRKGYYTDEPDALVTTAEKMSDLLDLYDEYQRRKIDGIEINPEMLSDRRLVMAAAIIGDDERAERIRSMLSPLDGLRDHLRTENGVFSFDENSLKGEMGLELADIPQLGDFLLALDPSDSSKRNTLAFVSFNPDKNQREVDRLLEEALPDLEEDFPELRRATDSLSQGGTNPNELLELWTEGQGRLFTGGSIDLADFSPDRASGRRREGRATRKGTIVDSATEEFERVSEERGPEEALRAAERVIQNQSRGTRRAPATDVLDSKRRRPPINPESTIADDLELPTDLNEEEAASIDEAVDLMSSVVGSITPRGANPESGDKQVVFSHPRQLSDRDLATMPRRAAKGTSEEDLERFKAKAMQIINGEKDENGNLITFTPSERRQLEDDVMRYLDGEKINGMYFGPQKSKDFFKNEGNPAEKSFIFLRTSGSGRTDETDRAVPYDALGDIILPDGRIAKVGEVRDFMHEFVHRMDNDGNEDALSLSNIGTEALFPDIIDRLNRGEINEITAEELSMERVRQLLIRRGMSEKQMRQITHKGGKDYRPDILHRVMLENALENHRDDMSPVEVAMAELMLKVYETSSIDAQARSLGRDAGYKDYLLSPVEVYARAQSQWMAYKALKDAGVDPSDHDDWVGALFYFSRLERRRISGRLSKEERAQWENLLEMSEEFWLDAKENLDDEQFNTLLIYLSFASDFRQFSTEDMEKLDEPIQDLLRAQGAIPDSDADGYRYSSVDADAPITTPGQTDWEKLVMEAGLDVERTDSDVPEPIRSGPASREYQESLLSLSSGDEAIGDELVFEEFESLYEKFNNGEISDIEFQEREIELQEEALDARLHDFGVVYGQGASRLLKDWIYDSSSSGVGQGEEYDSAAVRELQHAINDFPEKDVLWRGMVLDPETRERMLESGRVNMPIGATAGNDRTPFEYSGTGENSVLLRVEGANALPANKFSPVGSDDEWLVSGEFEIVSVDKHTTTGQFPQEVTMWTVRPIRDGDSRTGRATTDYRGAHTAPTGKYSEGGDTLDDLSMVMPDVAGPRGMEFYGMRGPEYEQANREMQEVLARATGDPDAEITIYRAVPAGVRDINDGDWVTPSLSYAQMHGDSWIGDDYEIVQTTIRAGDLNSDGNSLYEFGASIPTSPPGSEDNPIVTTDMKKAARHLADGDYVRLESEKQLSTLTDELRVLIKDENLETINMCKVSVPGTNVFCAEHKGIPRLEMPQIKGKAREGSEASKLTPDKDGEVDATEAFLDHLKSKGIAVSEVKQVRADQLRASQNELDGVKVLGMIEAATAGKFDPGEKAIFISKEGYVIDGHHRWAAQVGTDSLDGELGDLTMNVIELDLTITEALSMSNDFADEFGIKPKVVKGNERTGRATRKRDDAIEEMWALLPENQPRRRSTGSNYVGSRASVLKGEIEGRQNVGRERDSELKKEMFTKGDEGATALVESSMDIGYFDDAVSEAVDKPMLEMLLEASRYNTPEEIEESLSKPGGHLNEVVDRGSMGGDMDLRARIKADSSKEIGEKLSEKFSEEELLALGSFDATDVAGGYAEGTEPFNFTQFVSAMHSSWADDSQQPIIQVAAAKRAGLSTDQIVEQVFWQYETPDEQDEIRRKLKQLERGESVEIGGHYITPESLNLTEKWLETESETLVENLRERGVTHITLYRGVNPNTYEEDNITDMVEGASPLTSWAYSFEPAGMFVGGERDTDITMLEASVPIEALVSGSFLGFGCLHEDEIIVDSSKVDPDLVSFRTVAEVDAIKEALSFGRLTEVRGSMKDPGHSTFGFAGLKTAVDTILEEKDSVEIHEASRAFRSIMEQLGLTRRSLMDELEETGKIPEQLKALIDEFAS